MKLTYILSLLLYAILASSCQAPDSWELGSKDNNIRFVLKNKPVGTDCQLYYIVYYKDKVAVGESRLGLTMDMHNYGTNAQFISASPVKDISESYQLKAGKRMNTTNDCREQTFTFNSDNDRSLNWLYAFIMTESLSDITSRTSTTRHTPFKKNTQNLPYQKMAKHGYIHTTGTSAKSPAMSNTVKMGFPFAQNANWEEDGHFLCCSKPMACG